MNHKIKNVLALTLFTFSVNLTAAPLCSEIFRPRYEKEINQLKNKNLDVLTEADYDSHSVKSYKILKQIIEKNASLLTSSNIIKPIENILSDEKLSSFHIFIAKILKATEQEINETHSVADIQQVLKNETLKHLSEIMSVKNAENRIKLFDKNDLTTKESLSLFGKMSAEESLIALIGENGIDNIAEDSLVGRYLKQAGKSVSTFKSDFKKGKSSQKRGDQKLFISVDAETVKVLQTVINGNPNLLFHNHTYHQGTLQLLHRDTNINYAKYNSAQSIESSFRIQSILPAIVLSSIEASNVTNYFDLGKLNGSYSKYPWSFKNIPKSGKKSALEFCAHGGYESCTHWVGEMPIGENKVSEYSFPGNADQHGSSTNDHLYSSPHKIRTNPVGTFNSFVSYSTTYKIGDVKRVDRLARMVWTQGQGHEQFWSVIGNADAQKALSRGEYANPGWVIYNLLSKSKNERVPVVFIFTENAETPLDQNSIEKLNSTIHAY